MSKLNQARTKFNERLRKAGGERIPAILGDGDDLVDVPNRPGWDYARIDDIVIQAYNQATGSINDLPVWVRKDTHGDTQIMHVVGVRVQGHQTVEEGGTYQVTPHGSSHRWLAAEGGNDPVLIEMRQFLPLRISTDGFEVTVYPGIVPLDDNWLPITAQMLDLSDDVPTTSDYGCFVLLYLNDDILTAAVGSEKEATLLGWSDVPDLPNRCLALAIVYLYEGQTQINESQTQTDIFDVRWPQQISANTIKASDLQTRYEPLTNGNATSPELVFTDGDVIMVEVAN